MSDSSDYDPAAAPHVAGASPNQPSPSTGDVSAESELEDDSPDYVRMGILSVILLVLVGVFVYTRYINPPKKPFYATLPGLQLSGLNQEQQAQVLKLTNETECGCGLPNCTYNIAECRHMDPGCDNSLRRAGEIYQQVSGKQPVFLTPLPSAAVPPAGVVPASSSGVAAPQPPATSSGPVKAPLPATP